MATIGNAPVFPTESVLPGNLQVTGNATISGSSATVNGDEVRTLGTSGAIVQVVQNTYSTLTTISIDTYTDTGLSASITPTSSSNKILVITNQQYQWLRNNVDQGAGIRLLRDSTEIWAPPFGNGPYYNYTDNSAENNNYANIVYLDSPATTSSVTYKTQGRPYTTGSNGRARFQVENVVSLILLMEVVA